MSDLFEDVVVAFDDSVLETEIDKYVEELISAGGKLKFAWYRNKGGAMGNAFSARIPVSCLETFKSLRGGGQISSIEPDGIVTTQETHNDGDKSKSSDSAIELGPFEDVIVTFEDSVPTEEIDKHVKELEAAGGKVKYYWYRQQNGIKAFAARIPVSSLEGFKNLQAGGKIKHIESDGVVTTQHRPEPSEDLIVAFEDDVSTEEIDRHVKELELAGGKVKYYWYRQEDSVMGKAFAARIPVASLEGFKNLQAGGKIKRIESDGKVTTQAKNLPAPTTHAQE